VEEKKIPRWENIFSSFAASIGDVIFTLPKRRNSQTVNGTIVKNETFIPKKPIKKTSKSLFGNEKIITFARS
jgi:hypothetical protein